MIGTLLWIAFFLEPTPGHQMEMAHKNRFASVRAAALPAKPPRPTGAEASAAMRFAQRQNGQGIIPANVLEEGRKALEQLPELTAPQPSALDDAGVFGWQYLGPNKIGGRVRALLFLNDTTILLGAVTGGIWKTTNSGYEWTVRNEFMPSLSINSLTRDAQSGGQIYAGTGEWPFVARFIPGAGVYRSDDFGETFYQLPSTTQWDFVRVFAHPFASNTLYAAVGGTASENGVWRSTNGGTTWNKILITTAPCVDVKTDVESWNDMIACTQDGKVYYSGNGGSTWSDRTNGTSGLPIDGGRCEVAFGLDTSIYIAMNRNGGEIYKAISGSNAFALQNTGSNYMNTQGNYNNAIWVAKSNMINPIPPFNVQELVVVGGIDLHRSISGGPTLLPISEWATYHMGVSAHADQHVIVAHPGFNNTLPNPNREVWVGNDGGVQKAANIDIANPLSSWENMNNFLGITQFYHGDVSTNGSRIIGGAQDNDTITGSIGDANGWFQSKTGDGGFCAIDPNNDSTMYSEYVWLSMYRTTNAGTNWFQAKTGLGDADDPASALFIAPFVHHPTTSNTLVAGGRRLWRTTNGTNWTLVRNQIAGSPTPLCSALDWSPTDLGHVWAGYHTGQLARSTDGGLTWTTINMPPVVDNLWVTDIAIRPNSPNEVFVTYGGYLPDRIWYTPNGGVSWENRSGGANPVPNIQVNTIAFHPFQSQWVYIGTDLGVLASEDVGVQWNRTPRYGGTINHEGPRNIIVNHLTFDSNKYLYAFTYGRGAWRAWVPDIIYVDKNHVGAEVGTLAEPFRKVSGANDSTGSGHTYSIKSNTYTEGPRTYNKRGKFVSRDGPVVIKR